MSDFDDGHDDADKNDFDDDAVDDDCYDLYEMILITSLMLRRMNKTMMTISLL